MSDANFASLGATLLARKGGAKPAMRPQWGELPESVADEQLEDLGWNDMGADDADGADGHAGANSGTDNAAAEDVSTANPKSKSQPKGKGADIVSINPAAKISGKRQAANEDCDAKAPLIQAKPAKKKSASKTHKAPKKSAKSAASTASKNSSRRAAFTLRLDADRHLKLRLAATMQGVSAQTLVTEALDTMLSEIDDLDTLVASMTTRMKRH
jgi:predicted HicB family RNase H-like nuclease